MKYKLIKPGKLKKPGDLLVTIVGPVTMTYPVVADGLTVLRPIQKKVKP